jgi:hypothetical protein
MQTAKRPALSACRPGSSNGLLRIVPRSLKKAITEPVKVSAPTNTPTKISISCSSASVGLGAV